MEFHRALIIHVLWWSIFLSKVKSTKGRLNTVTVFVICSCYVRFMSYSFSLHQWKFLYNKKKHIFCVSSSLLCPWISSGNSLIRVILIQIFVWSWAVENNFEIIISKKLFSKLKLLRNVSLEMTFAMTSSWNDSYMNYRTLKREKNENVKSEYQN